MAITFSVRALDEQAFGYAMGNLTRAVQRGLVDPEIGTLGKQAQLLTEHCMKLTPPNNVGQGKRRVAADVAMLFNPLNPAALRDKSLQRLARNGTMEEWNAMARAAKRGDFAGKQAVEPSVLLHQPHKLALVSGRRGNVRKRLPKWVTLWKQRGALRQTIRAIQERVGWARAGWLRGYYALGGARVSEWVARHGVVRGIFVDGRSDQARPFVEVRNDTNWGRHGESDRIVRNALQARSRAMQSYFNKMMELSAKGIATPWQALQAQISAQFFGGSNGGG